ncbi:large conductance mechanosensitive channel protein MscL [Nakamurella sp.]|uniref:large conductance mechanosensitive channel protein MscL n=1 Tax=Nakamurella sp. TaxID=1869182 RepID=UPI0037832824
MIKGFKDFLLRGNVVDLAVAVVVGAAFTALVAAVTANLIQPVLNALGGVDTGSIGFYVNPSKPESYINISAILNAIITFAITALVVYFVFVAPMKKLSDLAAKKKVPVKADPTEVELLMEIRNLLREQNTASSGAGTMGPAKAPETGA